MSIRYAKSTKDNSYSIAKRIKYVNYNNANILFNLYTPKLSTINKITSY